MQHSIKACGYGGCLWWLPLVPCCPPTPTTLTRHMDAYMTTVVHSALTGTRAQDAARTVQTPDAADVSGLDQRKHAAPWPVLLRVCTSRMFKVEFARNWEACAIRWCLALFIGLVTGVLFLQLPTTFPVRCPLHPAPSPHPPCAALAHGLAGASHRIAPTTMMRSPPCCLLPPCM